MSEVLIVYTGNEGGVEGYWSDSGYARDLADHFGGAALYIEHRYFGQTLPFGNDSFTRENIKYLSVEAALADYAVVVGEVVGETSPFVLAVGGSYGGMLATYARFAYPAVFHGAIAASAPIAQIDRDSFVPDPPYFTAVTNNVAEADPRCADIVRAGFTSLLSLYAKNDTASIRSAFQICDGTPVPDAWTLQQWAQTAIGTSLGMGNNPWAADWVAPLPAWPAPFVCTKLLLPQAATPLAALAEIARVSNLGYPAKGCVNIRAEFLECADASGCGAGGPSALAWDYLACTELHYAPRTNNVTDMFPADGWNATTRDAYCARTWGTPSDSWTAFGEKFNVSAIMEGASRIIFSNFEHDPWHGGGISYGKEERQLLVTTSTIGAHHADLWSSSPTEAPGIAAVHADELAAVERWVLEGKEWKGE
jgi:dipeptidyl-peptidase-2